MTINYNTGRDNCFEPHIALNRTLFKNLVFWRLGFIKKYFLKVFTARIEQVQWYSIREKKYLDYHHLVPARERLTIVFF